MKHIKVLGSGCKSCETTANLIRIAADRAGVEVELEKVTDLAEIHSNILTGMMDAFASVISNNLNVVMKFLTSITIILMLPTLIAAAALCGFAL